MVPPTREPVALDAAGSFHLSSLAGKSTACGSGSPAFCRGVCAPIQVLKLVCFDSLRIA